MKISYILGAPLLLAGLFFGYLTFETSINTFFHQDTGDAISKKNQTSIDETASFVESHPAAPEEVEETKPALPEIDKEKDYYQLAMKAKVNGDNTSASEYLKQALIADPKKIEVRKQARLHFSKTQTTDDLIGFYQLLMKEFPKEANYPASLGTIFMTEKKDLEEARALFEKALQIDPKNGTAIYNLDLLKK